ncbi:hypothetical protein ACFWPX_22805 [Nocardia sp. NPDC058518]|uniref:hypothetical protein n=1 Tax=Nocardia sp. NPDC058518 TaxID=3346534 RepID=UPI00365C5A57
MTDKVEVDPAQLQRLAADADALRDRLAAIAAKGVAAVAPGSAAWGGDRYGNRFTSADGANFAVRADQLRTTTTELGEAFDTFASGEDQSKSKINGTENGNTDLFR